MTRRPLVVRTAAVWGSTVVGVRDLRDGQSLRLGSAKGLPKPEGCRAVDELLRADGRTWQLDTNGASEAALYIGGKTHGPTSMSSLSISEGDHGLLRYGNYSLFFQVTREPPALRGRLQPDAAVFVALLLAVLLVVGGLGLIRSITSPAPLAKPLELESRASLGKRLSLQLSPPPNQLEAQNVALKDTAENDELDFANSIAASYPLPTATASSRESTFVRLLGAELHGENNGLSEQRIHRIVSLHGTGFSECKVLRDVTTVIKFSVAATGSVTAADISETTRGSPAFPRCVLRRFRQLSFPVSHAPTSANYRFASR